MEGQPLVFYTAAATAAADDESKRVCANDFLQMVSFNFEKSGPFFL